MHKRIIFTFLLLTIFIINSSLIYGKLDEIKENSAIVLDSDGLSILYDKNSNEKIFPASTTKVLTAILAIENLDLNSNITVSDTALKNVPSGSSIIYLKTGETLTVRDLLYGLMLPSGSDAANVLAESISGSIPNFVALMNNKLKDIGCVNSHFTNPHGFHDSNHYSTAYDMALLMRYASQNDLFRNICETKEYTINATSLTSTARKLENTDLLLSDNFDYTLGGKTGYTGEAGNVFICYASLNGNNVICSVYDGVKNILDKKIRFTDTKMLLDNSFEIFKKKKILNTDTFKISYIDKKTHKNYILGIDTDVSCLTDSNPYFLNYFLTGVSINSDIINGEINVQARNESWKFNNSYKLKVIEVQNYIDSSILFDNKNYIILLIIFISIILIIILSSRKKKNRKVRKKY